MLCFFFFFVAIIVFFFFFFQAEDGIRDIGVTGVQTCALPILQNKHLFYCLKFQFRGCNRLHHPTSYAQRAFVILKYLFFHSLMFVSFNISVQNLERELESGCNGFEINLRVREC